MIVDDHSGFRSQARALLEAEGFEALAEAEDGMSALAVVARLHPRIVRLDIQLPDIDGFEVAERPWISAALRDRYSERVRGRLPLPEALRDELGPPLLASAVQHLEVGGVGPEVDAGCPDIQPGVAI